MLITFVYSLGPRTDQTCTDPAGSNFFPGVVGQKPIPIENKELVIFQEGGRGLKPPGPVLPGSAHVQQYVGPDLDPNYLTLWWYQRKDVFENVHFT